MKDGFKVSVVQASPVPGEWEGNLLEVERRVDEAKKAGSDLVVFPELFMTGYDIGQESLRRLAEPKDGPNMRKIQALARAKEIAIAVSYPEREGASFYNSAALFDSRGQLVLNYHKCHLWSSYEKEVFTPGSREDLAVVDLDGKVKVGILVCFDIEFPEPARVLALKGAELIIVTTALGKGPVDYITPVCCLATRAQENHVFIAYSNFPEQPEHKIQERKGAIQFCGLSAIVAPDGSDLARAERKGNALLSAPCHLGPFVPHIQRNPYLQERRPDLYQNIASKL